MIYLMLFLIDFYKKFHAIFSISTIFLTVFILLVLFIRLAMSKAVILNEADDLVLYWWNLTGKVLKYKVSIIFCICFAILIPSPTTLNIATGIYVGEVVVDKVKDTPLAQKAYQLAEKKIDELLEESQTKDNK